MRDDRERLLDILESVELIEKYAAKGRAAFEQDELIQTWFLQHLQIIGEASRALSAISENHILKFLGPKLSVCAIFWCIIILRLICLWSGTR